MDFYLQVWTAPNTYLPTTYIKGEMSINNITNQQWGLGTSLIPYSSSSLADPSLWNSNVNPISIFGTIEKSAEDIKNVITSLNYIAFFIDKRDIKNNRESNIPYLKGFGQAA